MNDWFDMPLHYRRTTATGTNNTSQIVEDEMGLVPGELAEGEGKALPEGLAEAERMALPGRLVDAAERLGVIPIESNASD